MECIHVVRKEEYQHSLVIFCDNTRLLVQSIHIVLTTEWCLPGKIREFKSYCLVFHGRKSVPGNKQLYPIEHEIKTDMKSYHGLYYEKSWTENLFSQLVRGGGGLWN